jgi:hypothetical protein
MITSSLTDWLLSQGGPWVRYRTLTDLLDRPPDATEVIAARQATLDDPRVQGLISEAATWPGYPLKRHSDAGHPIYKFSTLADFGLRAEDLGPAPSSSAMLTVNSVEGPVTSTSSVQALSGVEGMAPAIEAVLAHQSPEGAFQSLVNIPQAFGGTGEDAWTWMLCDAPTLLYALLAMGLGNDERVQRAADHLVGLVDEGGWRCVAAPELGKFRGPGRKADPCPMANVYALKALAQVPELLDSPATRAGTEILLWHWEHQTERKIYMFGIGTTFRRLKYPFVWYDILHVVDVLSRFPFVHADPRFREMVKTITAQAGEDGRYRAGSMYRAWKGWEFADKRSPSPWITFLVRRVLKRVQKEGGNSIYD